MNLWKLSSQRKKLRQRESFRIGRQAQVALVVTLRDKVRRSVMFAGWRVGLK